jgi:hypothetical protein
MLQAAVNTVVASHDGALLAENPSGGGPVVVRRTSDWSVAASLALDPGSAGQRPAVLGFSWGGKRVAVRTATAQGTLSVLDVASGGTLWSRSGLATGGVAVTAHTGDEALSLTTLDLQQHLAWFIVDAAGAAHQVV